MKEKGTKDTVQIAYANWGLGYSFFLEKRYREALPYFQQALHIYPTKYKERRLDALIGLALLHARLSEPDLAEDYLNQALEIVEKVPRFNRQNEINEINQIRVQQKKQEILRQNNRLIILLGVIIFISII